MEKSARSANEQTQTIFPAVAVISLASEMPSSASQLHGRLRSATMPDDPDESEHAQASDGGQGRRGSWNYFLLVVVVIGGRNVATGDKLEVVRIPTEDPPEHIRIGHADNPIRVQEDALSQVVSVRGRSATIVDVESRSILKVAAANEVEQDVVSG
jgi:hypothetical protein